MEETSLDGITIEELLESSLLNSTKAEVSERPRLEQTSEETSDKEMTRELLQGKFKVINQLEQRNDINLDLPVSLKMELFPVDVYKKTISMLFDNKPKRNLGPCCSCFILKDLETSREMQRKISEKIVTGQK